MSQLKNQENACFRFKRKEIISSSCYCRILIPFKYIHIIIRSFLYFFSILEYFNELYSQWRLNNLLFICPSELFDVAVLKIIEFRIGKSSKLLRNSATLCCLIQILISLSYQCWQSFFEITGWKNSFIKSTER